MITDLVVFGILCMLQAPTWCFVAIGISVLIKIINFGMNLGARQSEKALDEAIKRSLNEISRQRDK
jgi:hypothetical protein